MALVAVIGLALVRDVLKRPSAGSLPFHAGLLPLFFFDGLLIELNGKSVLDQTRMPCWQRFVFFGFLADCGLLQEPYVHDLWVNFLREQGEWLASWLL